MIRLHHCHQTRSMRTLWLLQEMGVAYELVEHAFDNSLRSEKYLALHPVGRVPSLEIDGRILWETGAITEILCERFPDAHLGRPAGHPERADWLIWLHFSETISQHTAALTQQHIALYEDSMRSPVIMKLEAKRLEKCCGAVDSALAGRDYFLSAFSAADVSIGQAMYMAGHFVRLEKFKNLSRWYSNVTQRPAFKASLPPAGANTLYKREFYEPWDG